MPRKIKYKQALLLVFRTTGLVNRAYYFVFIPFFTSLLVFIAQQMMFTTLVNALLLLAAAILSIFYQLYLWSVSFFYAQQISEHDWDEYGLDYSELISDFGVKLKLLVLRTFWLLPLALALATYLALNPELLDLGQASKLLQDEAEGGYLAIFFLVGFLWSLISENIFVNLSEYTYSETGSVLKSLNPFTVLKNFWKVKFEYLVVLFLSLTPIVIMGIIFLPLLAVSFIPIVGALILGLVLGLRIMYNTLFLANIKGQIWAKLNEE